MGPPSSTMAAVIAAAEDPVPSKKGKLAKTVYKKNSYGVDGLEVLRKNKTAKPEKGILCDGVRRIQKKWSQLVSCEAKNVDNQRMLGELFAYASTTKCTKKQLVQLKEEKMSSGKFNLKKEKDSTDTSKSEDHVDEDDEEEGDEGSAGKAEEEAEGEEDEEDEDAEDEEEDPEEQYDNNAWWDEDDEWE